MSKFISPKIAMTTEIAPQYSPPPSYSNREVVRLLRSAVRDFHEAIQMLDSSRQSETAGRLHALSVELRELAADTEMTEIDGNLLESIHGHNLQ